MKQMELSKMGVSQLKEIDLHIITGGTSFAHDIGTGIRWLYKFCSYGGTMFGMQMADLDYYAHQAMNSKK